LRANDLVLGATHLRRIENGGGELALVFFRINQVAATCELVHSPCALRSPPDRRSQVAGILRRLGR